MAVRYSHPPNDRHDGVALVDHLEDVAQRVRYVVPEAAQTPAGEPLRVVVETLAYVHDFGKATTFFQDYLRHSTEPNPKQCRYHAPIGSFAAYYALAAQGFETETCLAGFVAVAKHHGRLPDVADYVFSRTYRRENVSRGDQTATEKQQAAIVMQLNDIDEHVPTLAEEMVRDATNGQGSWATFREEFPHLLEEIRTSLTVAGAGTTVSRETFSESCYGLVLECWGSLVLADKTSAASAASGMGSSQATYEADVPSRARLDEHVDELEASADADPDGTRRERLDHYRSRAREDIVANAETFADGDGNVATLTLPTGMGKTLSGLAAAMAIRDRMGGSRIVYALPFTSIIDQVVDEVEEIYQTDTTGRLLTAHHHLSETTIVDERDDSADDADGNDDVAGMLAESWRAGLTVTTFVQLFESLTGPANTQSMKLPALRNSVVVLDEPQSLPLDWWKLVSRLVTMLTEQYDASVIAMTATQPQLFDDATELVDSPETYFDAAERVRYELDPSTERYIETQAEPKSYEDATATLLDGVGADESALVVCNTIDSAQTLTDRVSKALPDATDVGAVYAAELKKGKYADGFDPKGLAEQVDDRGTRSVLHLSTRLRPVDRLRLVETARALTEERQSLLTISTQLVEAGVDISFDRVYRDLAPIDSIVQAAGRCNRSFERDRGHVTVWWLDAPGEQTKTPAEAVYNRGISLLPVAAETLDSVRSANGVLSEVSVAKRAVEQYYERLHDEDEKNVGKQAYVEYVDDARGDELGELSLIDQRLSVDVVVCRTESDRNRIRRIKSAWKNYEFDDVRREMDELNELTVSIPIYRPDSEEARALSGLTTIHGETDIRWIDARDSRHNSYFDVTTGLSAESSVENRIL